MPALDRLRSEGVTRTTLPGSRPSVSRRTRGLGARLCRRDECFRRTSPVGAAHRGDVLIEQGGRDDEGGGAEGAEEDDGSCVYPEPIFGCTDPDAMNYDETATDDDGSCEYLETIPCNGMVILCHRPYDEVTFPETHYSFSTHEDNIYYPASNHLTGFQAQWNAGMRAVSYTHLTLPTILLV